MASDGATRQSRYPELQEICDHVEGLIGDNEDLDFDYFSKNLNLNPPPGMPSFADRFKPVNVEPDLQLQHIKVAVRTGLGDGVIMLYRGPFRSTPPQSGESWRLYIGLRVARKVEFAEVPIAGPIEDGALGVAGIHLLIATHTMEEDECDALYRALIMKPPSHELGHTDYNDLPVPPLDGFKCHVLFKTDLLAAFANYPLQIEGPEPPAASGQDGAAPPGATAGTPVQKTIGPLSIIRVFGTYDYKKNELGIGLDASLGFGLFELFFQDLVFAWRVTGDEASAIPTLSFRGVEVRGKLPKAVELEGGLYIDQLSPLSLWGEVIVKIGQQYTLAAMAGYATMDSHPAFFGYGFLRVPGIGPPFLQFNGLALGGAYSRDLVIPEVDALDRFPFIQAAMSFADPAGNFKNPFPADVRDPNSLINTLNVLGTKIAPPTVGAYWGTLGAAFSSCKIINGFALVSVLAGRKLQFSAVAEAQVRIPALPPGVSGPAPMVFLDFFLRVVVDPDSGEIAVDGYLNHTSVIIERVHVTGGVAIRVWTGGPHRGEFVICAGGYSPHVDMSDFKYYPQVPRLSMSLNLGNGITVEGRMYAATTSVMKMFGMTFNVSGTWGGIYLWAVVDFDALIDWDPLHYSVNVAVAVGASVRIKVWFVHITITVHVGASLHIWGPPFSGDARLDLTVCTLSWHLGAQAACPPRLTWSEFKDRYLQPVHTDPDEPPEDQSKAVSDIQMESTPIIVLKRRHAEDAKWVVDPENWVARTATAIPSKTWTVTGKGEGTAPNTAFGVRPCKVANDHFHADHIVTLSGSADTQISITPVLESVPGALWGPDITKPIGPDTVIADVIVGLEIRPRHASADNTLPADAENLLGTHDVLHVPVTAAPASENGGGFPGTTVSGSIASAPADANRRELFGALDRYRAPGDDGDVTIDTVDVSGFANGSDADLFTNPPRLRLLGEDRG